MKIDGLTMDLSIVIVNYNGRDLLDRCLASVYCTERSIRFETIVVDNGSSDGSQQWLDEHFPQVVAILNEENKGFAAANNQGIRKATGEFLLLLNSDTEIIGDGLERSVEFLRRKPEAGIVGCKLVFPDGKLQRSVRSFPNIWNLFCEASFLYAVFPHSRLFGRYYLSSFDYGQPARVDWVSGAFLVFGRKIVEQVGVLDEQFFMYSEEMDFCFRARSLGYETWYTPSATTIHHWLTVDTVTVRGTAWLLLSQLLYIEKHFKGLRQSVMKSLKYGGVLFRFFVYPVAGLVSMNRVLLHQWRCLLIASWRVAKAGIHYREGGSVANWTPLS